MYKVINKIIHHELIYHVADKEINKLSHRQKQRAQKRLVKNQQLKENAKKLLKKETNPKEQIQLKNVCLFFI